MRISHEAIYQGTIGITPELAIGAGAGAAFTICQFGATMGGCLPTEGFSVCGQADNEGDLSLDVGAGTGFFVTLGYTFAI